MIILIKLIINEKASIMDRNILILNSCNQDQMTGDDHRKFFICTQLHEDS